MRVMISGPMTGLPNHNLDAFFAAEKHLAEAGYDVENPAHLGVLEGYEWEDYIRHSIGLLIKCEALYMLEGWEDSRGARAEFDLANLLKMTIMYEAPLLLEPPC